jgi:hypothetical protein
MKRRSVLLGLFALPILDTTPLVQAASGALREGIDFCPHSPPRPHSQPGIEVIEVFSYGCPTATSSSRR